MTRGCGRNSSYSFIQNFLKLCRYFCHGLKMCMCFWGYPPIIFYQIFSTFFNIFQVPISIRLKSLWIQLILQFPHIILKLCKLVLHDPKMCVWFWSYPPIIFYQLFSLFWLIFFPISVGIDTLWVQLLLEFSTNHFETIFVLHGLKMCVWFWDYPPIIVI